MALFGALRAVRCDLTFSVVLGIVHIVGASRAASLQRGGYRWTASARDGRLLRGVAGRLDRALRNFLETFPLLVAASLLE